MTLIDHYCLVLFLGNFFLQKDRVSRLGFPNWCHQHDLRQLSSNFQPIITPKLIHKSFPYCPVMLHMGRVSNYKCLNLSSLFQCTKQLIYLLGFNFQCMSSMYTTIRTPNSHRMLKLVFSSW